MPLVDIDVVRQRSVKCLEDVGVKAEQAELLVDHMLTADLWGRSSHGLSVRFEAMHDHAVEEGGGQPIDIVKDAGHHVVLDANGGFGYVAGRRTAEMLAKRTAEHGVACAVLRNSIHTGMLGYYGNFLAQKNIVSIIAADCLPLMAPCGGAEALLGTNPICFGFPADDDPILVDMATSGVSYGKVTELDEAGEELSEGVALDDKGCPTRDPGKARDGALLPFGGHRGGALAVAVQLLAGVLTGAEPVPDDGDGYGLLMVGFQKGVFAEDEVYDSSVREFIARYRAVPERTDGEVRLPGRRRYHNQRETLKRGVVEISDDLASLLGLENGGG